MSWTEVAEAPAPQHGPSWSESGILIPPAVQGGWFALLEKVVPSVGVGQLSAVLTPHTATQSPLRGEGTLSVVIGVHYAATTAVFSSDGVLVGQVWPIRALDAAFSGGGELGVITNDGLTAVITVIPGAAVDGLSATVVPVTGVSVGAPLAGVGMLSAVIIGQIPRAAGLSGAGTLSAVIVGQAPRAAALSGGGTLSATVTAVMPAPVALAGSGALSAAIRPVVDGLYAEVVKL